MKISQYLLYVGFILILAASGIVLGHGLFAIYFQLESLLFMLVGWLIPTVFLVGFKKTGAYYKEAFSAEGMKAPTRKYFQGMSLYLLALGFSGLVIGIINMMVNLENSQQLGTSMAIALLSLLYNLILALIISIPIWAFGKLRDK
jgi:hypothetical protein